MRQRLRLVLDAFVQIPPHDPVVLDEGREVARGLVARESAPIVERPEQSDDGALHWSKHREILSRFSLKRRSIER
jgi:hypothetical protein